MKTLIKQNSLSLAWCSVIVETLQRYGIKQCFLSPGYRDAPFAAVLRESQIQTFSCMDERAAAYQALGAAKYDGCPSLLVCTSGTAVANYLPAVIEASQEHVPLIILSCDRPPELVRSGANQCIRQQNILGSYVRSFVDLPCPEGGLSAPMLESLLVSALDEGLSYPSGPVHFNVPLRAPLEPRNVPSLSLDRFLASCQHLRAKAFKAVPVLEGEARQDLEDALAQAKRGILILGRFDSRVNLQVVRDFAKALDWPVYADVSSSLKYELSDLLDPELDAMGGWLEEYQADMVLHLGRRLTTKYWDIYLSKRPDLDYWVVTPERGQQNPAFTPYQKLHSQSFEFLSQLKLPAEKKSVLALRAYQEKVDHWLRQDGGLSFPSFARSYLDRCHDRHLFLGNSSSIRAFDTWVGPGDGQARSIEVNRGASGIEGLVSTTIGLCLSSRAPWDVVLGDVSLIHDINSLYQLSLLDVPVRVFVVNNYGGQIFKKLPLKDFPEVMDPLVSTPHSFSFAGLCSDIGLSYMRIGSKSDLDSYLNEVITGPQLIELMVDEKEDLRVYQQLNCL